MKKFWKIFGITIGTLLGVVLLVIGTAIYVVFTPKRLTPIVRDIANQYVSCEHEIGEVELTFFSTFPDFGLRIDGLYLIHPMEGAQSDTLFAAKEAVVVVNPIRFLKEQTLDVQQITLNNTSANIFTNENGVSNLDVFVFPADTTAEEDTTRFSLPFEQLNIDLMSTELPQTLHTWWLPTLSVYLSSRGQTARRVPARYPTSSRHNGTCHWRNVSSL